MPSLRGTISLSLDRSVDASFAHIRKEARKTSETVARELVVRGRGSGGQNPELVAARAAHAEQSKLNREIFRAQVNAQKQLDAEGRRLARQRTREALAAIRSRQKEEQAALRERERGERRLASAEQALNRQRSSAMYSQYRAREREIDRLATRTSHRATRFLFPRPEGALGFARRTASEITRGMGIDFSFGGGISRANELQASSQLLSQNAWQPGAAGPAGQKVAGSVLEEEARNIAVGPGRGLEGGAQAVTEGRAKFVSVTGDLETARQVSAGLAELSAATGANFADAMEAAAAISNKLGDVPDKAKKINELMRGFAWQGKLGAVEISDMAKSMPRLLSGVTRFSGDLGENMRKLGVLAQMARGGPAGTAREAVTGVARFADLLVTPTRLKAMYKLGMKRSDIFDKSGAINDPFEVVKKALIITKGDPVKMRQAFASVMGSRPVERFTDLYRNAGGGKKGLAAVDAETKRLLSGSGTGMSEDVVKQLADEYGNTRQAKARKFQEAFDRITADAAEKLAPALERLEQPILAVAERFGNFISWVPENIGKAAAIAVSYAILRALGESFMRGLLERVIRARAGGGGGGGGGGGAPASNKSGAIGTGLGLGLSAATALYAYGTSEYSSGVKTTDEISKGLVDVHGADLGMALVEAKNKLKKYQQDKGFFGGIISDIQNVLPWGEGDKAEVAGLEELIARKRGEFEQWKMTGGDQTFDKDAEKKIRETWNWKREGLSSPIDQNAIGRGVADAMKGQTLNVRVTNSADFGVNSNDGGARVDESGRRRNGE